MIFLPENLSKNFFRLKSTELSTEYRYRRYSFKNVPLSVPSLLFSKVSVPISSLLLKYLVATAGNKTHLHLEMNFDKAVIVGRSYTRGSGGGIPSRRRKTGLRPRR